MTAQDPRPEFTQGAVVALLTLAACIPAVALLAWSLS